MEINAVRKIIQNQLGDYQRFVARAEESERYYANNTDILRNGTGAIDAVNRYLQNIGENPLKSADNRIPQNWHRILIDQKIGYGFTYPPQYATMRGDEQIEIDYDKLLGDSYADIIKKLALDASNTGLAWLHYWKNSEGNIDYYFIDPKQIFVVMDEASVKPKIKVLIRTYAFVGDDGESYMRYEMWNEREVRYYIKKASGGIKDIGIEYSPDGTERVELHGFNEIPFIKFENNPLCLRDLDMYKQIIDNLDKTWSGFANDIDDIQEIIWVLKNYSGETATFKLDENGDPILDDNGLPIKNNDAPDIMQQLKAHKYFLTDENGGVDTVRGEIPHEARMAFIEALTKQLFVSAMAVNPEPERTGNSSGVYIDFLYSLLELKMGLLENGFRKGLAKLIKVLGGYGDDITIVQTWTRNKPRNDSEIVQMIAQTPDTVMSAETKTKVHPLVEDYQQERATIEKEQKEMVMPVKIGDEDAED